MRIYVTLQPAPDKPCGKTVYSLLLPDGGEWGEVDVRKSAIEGFGVFPRNTQLLQWPYLGVECVTQDAHLLKLLVKVLRGEFEVLSLQEVRKATSRSYVQDGIFAVPQDSSSPRLAGRPLLPPATEILQVSHSENATKSRIRDVCGGDACVCYLVSLDVQQLLQLSGTRAHLWALLKSHARHHHVDRHLATHIAHVWREEEGYVLINAHPAFEELLSLTGIINEPPAKVSPNMKMVVGYARFLPPGDPLLVERGLVQHKRALKVWRECMIPPVRKGVAAGTATAAGRSEWDDALDPYLSERMVMYATTRKAYSSGDELTVDYGLSYHRHYSSSVHRAIRLPYEEPSDTIDPSLLNAARWPSLPGWWNPTMQPPRAAFRQLADGSISCVDDDLALVLKRHQALGVPLTPELQAFSESLQHSSLSLPELQVAHPNGRNEQNHQRSPDSPSSVATLKHSQWKVRSPLTVRTIAASAKLESRLQTAPSPTKPSKMLVGRKRSRESHALLAGEEGQSINSIKGFLRSRKRA